jgi:hypothetical protein
MEKPPLNFPSTPTETIRSLLFEKVAALNQQLLKRLTDVSDHISRKETLGVIGALEGMDSEVETIRTLMRLVRDHF